MFWVTYTSNENTPPDYVNVKKTVTLENYTMVANDTEDVDYTDGKQYYMDWPYYPYITTANSFSIETHATGYAKITKIIPAKNSMPFPYLIQETALPRDDVAGNYTFSATYYSLFNYTPNKIQVSIDGIFHTMTKNDTGDVTYWNGVAYHYWENLSAGLHTYQFYCQDQPTTGNWTSGQNWVIVGPTSMNISLGAILLVAVIAAVLIGCFWAVKL